MFTFVLRLNGICFWAVSSQACFLVKKTCSSNWKWHISRCLFCET